MADKTPDPQLLFNWETNYTTTLIKFSIFTLVLLVLLILLFTIGNLQEIAKNFHKYRCNPIIMPFAANYGYDTQENFNYCLTAIFNVKAAEIFTPIYALLGQFTNLVTLIMNVALGIRKLFSNFLLGVNSFIRNVRDRIQGLLFNVRMSFLKLNNLMGRVYGTMYAVIWMGTSALTAGMNVSDNSLVKFLMEFCFDPSTPVQMADGSYKPISALVIGDKLASTPADKSPRVTSVFRFAGENTPMVKLHGVVLSAQHYVFHGTWMEARNHPDAEPVASIPELVCLNVTGNQFKVANGLLVADYDEHESADVVHATQRLALQRLNGPNADEEEPVDDYSLGIDGKAEVFMKDGTWKALQTIQLGEEVLNGGKVLGIVKEECDNTVEIDGYSLAAAQTIFDGTKWKRATHMGKETTKESKHLYQLITLTCGTLMMRFGEKEQFLRDYREIADPDMESAYAEKFMESM
jgi:hypothetical protein